MQKTKAFDDASAAPHPPIKETYGKRHVKLKPAVLLERKVQNDISGSTAAAIHRDPIGGSGGGGKGDLAGVGSAGVVVRCHGTQRGDAGADVDGQERIEVAVGRVDGDGAGRRRGP